MKNPFHNQHTVIWFCGQPKVDSSLRISTKADRRTSIIYDNNEKGTPLTTKRGYLAFLVIAKQPVGGVPQTRLQFQNIVARIFRAHKCEL